MICGAGTGTLRYFVTVCLTEKEARFLFIGSDLIREVL